MSSCVTPWLMVVTVTSFAVRSAAHADVLADASHTTFCGDTERLAADTAAIACALRQHLAVPDHGLFSIHHDSDAVGDALEPQAVVHHFPIGAVPDPEMPRPISLFLAAHATAGRQAAPIGAEADLSVHARRVRVAVFLQITANFPRFVSLADVDHASLLVCKRTGSFHCPGGKWPVAPQTTTPLAVSGRSLPASAEIPEQRTRGDFTNTTNTRAVIDACRPWHWRGRFPMVNMPSLEERRRARQRFGYLLK